MKIINKYKSPKTIISFEVFPPKVDDDIQKIYDCIYDLAKLNPEFISVTYGAGGSRAGKTIDVAEHLQTKYNIPSLAHLTCIGATKSQINDLLNTMKQKKVKNILALRGDMPKTGTLNSGEFKFATDLVAEIKKQNNFCIASACYPEGHIDCYNLDFDIEIMKKKQAAGVEFFISQLFFDNKHFLKFLEKARLANITVPISAGIMPIMSKSQIERMIFMCGASLPAKIVKILHKYENSNSDLYKAGLEYAKNQVNDLLKYDIDGIHIYTMNKPDIAKYIVT